MPPPPPQISFIRIPVLICLTLWTLNWHSVDAVLFLILLKPCQGILDSQLKSWFIWPSTFQSCCHALAGRYFVCANEWLGAAVACEGCWMPATPVSTTRLPCVLWDFFLFQVHHLLLNVLCLFLLNYLVNYRFELNLSPVAPKKQTMLLWYLLSRVKGPFIRHLDASFAKVWEGIWSRNLWVELSGIIFTYHIVLSHCVLIRFSGGNGNWSWLLSWKNEFQQSQSHCHLSKYVSRLISH